MSDLLKTYQSEIQKIAKKGRVDAGKIQVHEIVDHKNISLWTKEGKRIGPLHPHNAEKAFKLFWELGVQLSADQPTAEMIVAYKETPEYKDKLAKHLIVRERKNESKKKENMAKMIKDIATMTGMTVEAINRLAKHGEQPPAGVKTGGGPRIDQG